VALASFLYRGTRELEFHRFDSAHHANPLRLWFGVIQDLAKVNQGSNGLSLNGSDEIALPEAEFFGPAARCNLIDKQAWDVGQTNSSPHFRRRTGVEQSHAQVKLTTVSHLLFEADQPLAQQRNELGPFRSTKPRDKAAFILKMRRNHSFQKVHALGRQSDEDRATVFTVGRPLYQTFFLEGIDSQLMLPDVRKRLRIRSRCVSLYGLPLRRSAASTSNEALEI
jgi:hypothetical protein